MRSPPHKGDERQMDLDLSKLSRSERHSLLSSIVIPRPIAFVTTLSADGTLNAAPFSFFNIMGLEPPVVALGPDNHRSGEPKDTARNIRQMGEFVVNIVDEALAEKMNLCAIDFPPNVDELAVAGLTPVASSRVRPPRVAESPAALECREVATLEIGHNRIVIGEVLYLHLRDDLVKTDPLEVGCTTSAERKVRSRTTGTCGPPTSSTCPGRRIQNGSGQAERRPRRRPEIPVPLSNGCNRNGGRI
jgi:flavin reductase (DIM6/NTAB) family NADH-FMN oxidoreductase RutF